MKLDAILWDYDGTLVDSVPKNMEVTRDVLSVVTPRLSGDKLPLHLQNEAEYRQAIFKVTSWKELYIDYFGMTEAETVQAGMLWAEHQMKNTTPVELFSGIRTVIEALSHLPHGICSLNFSDNIRNVLQGIDLHAPFVSVVGYTDVGDNAQKPAPDSGIQCLADMFDEIGNKTIMYIGDHESDVEFARNLSRELGDKAEVISVAATYSGAEPRQWRHQPDHEISDPIDLLDLL